MPQRRLAAILAADIAGYSRLIERDESGTVERLRSDRRELIDPSVAKHGGHIVRLAGDGALIEFSSIVEATACAIAIQQGMRKRNAKLPAEDRIVFRMGVNIGDIIAEDDNMHGESINVAARLESLCDPGGVLISEEAARQVQGKVDAALEYVAERSVKNIERPVKIWKVQLSDSTVPTRRAGKNVEQEGAVTDLNPRELEVARAYSGGASYEDIAERLVMAPSAVRTHLDAVYRKLGVSSKMALFRRLEADHLPFDRLDERGMQIPFPARPTIAVLPFTCMSSDPDQEFFADGLTEDIISRLSLLRGLAVIARTSSFGFKGRAIRVQDIASDLGARYLLEGSARKAGNRVRITAQLIDGASGAHLWAERFDKDLVNVFEIQDEITRAIVSAVQIELIDGELVRRDAGTTQNLAAWEAFHRGVLALLEVKKTENLAARRLFEQALDLDPKYYEAKIYLGWTYWTEARNEFSDSPSRALANCWRLLTEVETDEEGFIESKYLAAACRLIERRHDEAIALADAAAKVGPCRVFGYTPAAIVHRFSANYQKSLGFLRATMQLSPFCPDDTIYHLAYALTWLGDHKNALDAVDDYLRRVPEDAYSYVLKAIVLDFAGQKDRSVNAVKLLRTQFPAFTLEHFIHREPYRNCNDLDRVTKVLRDGGLRG